MNYQEIAVQAFTQAAKSGVVVFTYKGENRVCTINKQIIETFLERPTMRGEVSYQDFIPNPSNMRSILMLEITKGSEISESIKRFNFDNIEWSL